jgi:hypothetical protein
MLKFWPQRAERRQLALEIPQPFTDGDLDFGDIYSASDLSWGFQLQAIEALLFGQALIDAFERNKPRVFLEPRPPQPKRKLTKEQQAEIDANTLSLIIGMNVGTLKAEGLWTPELQSLFDSCMTAESQSRDDHDEDRVRKDLAKLIVLTERRLKEHNIHYTSARDAHDFG